MTGHEEHDGTGLGRVSQRLLTDARKLAAAVTAHLADASEFYRSLPSEELNGDIRRITEQAIRGFAQTLRTGRPPAPDHLAEVRASAARRAEEGVPIEAVVTAYHLSAQRCVDALQPEMTSAEVIGVHRALLEYLRVALSQVATAYMEERQALIGETGVAHQTMLSALLDGTAVHDTAHRTEFRLPPCYVVLAMAIGPHSDEVDSDVNASVAARRKTRRIRAELHRQAGHAVLARITAQEALALLPRPGGPDDLDAADWARLGALTESLAKVAGAPIVAGTAAAVPADVADAARLAGDLRDLAVAFHRAPGVYRLPDLLIEHQLTRPGPARDQLADLLRPVQDKPDLLPTLRLYLQTNLSRRQVAAKLRVHPNTVDYRIRRIATLTGLDITDHTSLLKLIAALAALDAAQITAPPSHA